LDNAGLFRLRGRFRARVPPIAGAIYGVLAPPGQRRGRPPAEHVKKGGGKPIRIPSAPGHRCPPLPSPRDGRARIRGAPIQNKVFSACFSYLLGGPQTGTRTASPSLEADGGRNPSSRTQQTTSLGRFRCSRDQPAADFFGRNGSEGRTGDRTGVVRAGHGSPKGGTFALFVAVTRRIADDDRIRCEGDAGGRKKREEAPGVPADRPPRR